MNEFSEFEAGHDFNRTFGIVDTCTTSVAEDAEDTEDPEGAEDPEADEDATDTDGTDDAEVSSPSQRPTIMHVGT